MIFPRLYGSKLRTVGVVLMLWTAAATDAVAREYSYLDPRSVLHARQRAQEGDTQVQGAITALLNDARAMLSEHIPPITAKTVLPPSGDVHDYYSLSPYWWPDASKPDGLPYVRRDGRVNPERETIHDRALLRRVYAAVETFSLAYAFTGDEVYAAAAARLLHSWFVDPATRMNPSLTYAQIVRGNTKPRGAGIIEGRGMSVLAPSVELLSGSPHVTPALRSGLRAWFRDYLRWLEESPQGKDEIDAPNNHGSWYDVQRVSIAWVLGDTAKVREIAREARTLRIAAQIEPDGRQPQELRRTRGLHYCTFNLMALAALATIAERAGVDLWRHTTEDGRSIRRALDWLLPYAAGKQEWPYEQIAEYEPDFFFELLLRAAHVYGDDRYGQQAESLRGIDTQRHRGILLHQGGE